jgi:exosortase A-associated hydrolase 1
MNYEDRAIRILCGQDWLCGVLSLPEQVQAQGVLILAGGGQYRIGSHRQFALLARHLSSSGIPVMRFDFRGVGDSEGQRRDFDQREDEVQSAVDYFCQSIPGMTGVVIWGLCDAASAALLYAYRDDRITGLALLNPWARTDSGIAKTYLRHYYLARIFDRTLWRKIFRGHFNFLRAGRSLLGLVISAFKKDSKQEYSPELLGNGGSAAALPDRLFNAYRRFGGKVLLILSGEDLTAREFADLAASTEKWRSLLRDPRTTRFDLREANHTFSTREWRRQVETWTSEWLTSSSP